MEDVKWLLRKCGLLILLLLIFVIVGVICWGKMHEEETILEHSMKYQEVITWSTDGFFRETKEKVAYRKSEGCAVVEMECSALAACADFRGATWGMILYTADSLADVDKYDERNWGGNAYEYALTLCLDAVIKL